MTPKHSLEQKTDAPARSLAGLAAHPLPFTWNANCARGNSAEVDFNCRGGARSTTSCVPVNRVVGTPSPISEGSNGNFGTGIPGNSETELVCLFAHVRRFPKPRRRGAQPGNRNRLKHGGF